MSQDFSPVKISKIHAVSWGVIGAVVLIGLILYGFGYRFSQSFTPVKVGLLTIDGNQPGLQIFVDNREQRPRMAQTSYVLDKVVPGVHSVLLSKDGFWPWMKTVTVEQNKNRKIYAALFPINAKAVSVQPSDPRYQKFTALSSEKNLSNSKLSILDIPADESLKQWILKNVSNVKISENKEAAVWVQGKSIYLGWISDNNPPPHYFCETGNACKFIIPIIDLGLPVKSVDFYDGRDDVVIFASGATLYGIETNHEGIQNFQPFYRGTDPYFFKDLGGKLFVRDGQSLFEVTI